MKPTFKLHARQLEAFGKLTKDPVCREVLFGGAKNGGKSFLGASWIFSSALMYPGTSYFIARKEIGLLRAFTVPTIMEWFTKTGIDFDRHCSYNGLQGTFHLNNGSKVYLIACTHLPRDPLYERFGSMQFTQGWIEEGGEVPDMAYENLRLAIGRWNNDKYGLPYKLLITCNPKRNWMYREFYKPWSQGRLPVERYFVQSLVTDNVFRQKGSEKILDDIKDPVTKLRLRFGEWEYSEDQNALIQYEAIESLFTNTFVKAQGQKYLACDVARFGSDKTTIRVWHGYKVIHREEVGKSSTKQTADRIKALMERFSIPVHHCVIDEDGVGGGVIDQLPRGVVGFVANSSPINPKPGEAFENLKAQCGYKLAEMINDNQLYEGEGIGVDMADELKADLTQVKEKNVDKDGKRGLVSKEKVKQFLGRSPDHGDTYLMRMIFEVKRTTGVSFVSGNIAAPSNGRRI